MRLFCIAFSILPLLLQAQAEQKTPRFYVEANKHSVSQGEPLQLTYRYENGDKSLGFVPPNWDESAFEVLGSSQASSMSIVNGKVSSSVTYMYHVAPRDTGLLQAPLAFMRDEKTELRCEPLQITVSPDPDYVPRRQAPTSEKRATEPEPRRKKLKSIRI
jgi:BatD DUF11 like domain